MRALTFALSLAVLVFGSHAPQAAVMVLGDGLAKACSQAAYVGRSDPQSVKMCSRALYEENLSRRDEAGTLVNRGVMLLRQKDYGLALSDMDKAIALEPGLGEAYVNRGVLLMADRRYPEALDQVNRGLQLGIDQPAKGYYNRALIHEGLNDAPSAYRDYRRAQELDPQWPAPARQLVRFTVTAR